MYARSFLLVVSEEPDVGMLLGDVETDDALLLRQRQEDLMQVVQDYVWILRGKSHEVSVLEQQSSTPATWSSREDSWDDLGSTGSLNGGGGYWPTKIMDVVRSAYDEFRDSHKVAAGMIYKLRNIEIELDHALAALRPASQSPTSQGPAELQEYYMPPYPPRPNSELRQFSFAVISRDLHAIKHTGLGMKDLSLEAQLSASLAPSLTTPATSTPATSIPPATSTPATSTPAPSTPTTSTPTTRTPTTRTPTTSTPTTSTPATSTPATSIPPTPTTSTPAPSTPTTSIPPAATTPIPGAAADTNTTTAGELEQFLSSVKLESEPLDLTEVGGNLETTSPTAPAPAAFEGTSSLRQLMGLPKRG